MCSRQRPRNETIEGGRLRELLVLSLRVLLTVTTSIVVIILNRSLLPIIHEVRECTSQRFASAFVMYYSKIHQEVDAFIKALTEWSLTRT